MGRSDKPPAYEQEARRLLRRLSTESDLPARMERIARTWVGAPYAAGSLIGSADLPEQLVVRLDAFDCVTFVEAVLALARSRDLPGFVDELVLTRYRTGRVAWASRLHYFSDWLRANQRRGAVRIRTRGAGSRSIAARLSVVAGLPARRIQLQVIPRNQLERARRRLAHGSIVAFASTRAGLDFFHTGLLFGRDLSAPAAERTLIHAARSAARVVAEPLADFLRRNRMRGLVVAAPVETGGGR